MQSANAAKTPALPLDFLLPTFLSRKKSRWIRIVDELWIAWVKGKAWTSGRIVHSGGHRVSHSVF